MEYKKDLRMDRRQMRDYGKQHWNDGCGLIDTCMRTRNLGEKNTIALASKKRNITVQYKLDIKKEIYSEYFDANPEEIFIRMHCAGITQCLKDTLNELPNVFICAEGFQPHKVDHHLKIMLVGLYDSSKIHVLPSLVSMFGKENAAHILAKTTNKQGRPGLVLQKSHVSPYLSKRKHLNFLQKNK